MAIDILMWQQRFQRAEDLQRKNADVRKQAIKLYTSTFFTTPTDNDTEVSEVNFVYEFVDVMVSALFTRNPHIFVRTKVSELVPFQETMERMINKYWRIKNCKVKIKDVIKDSILQPPGWIELGYKFIKDNEKAQRQIEDEFPELKDSQRKEEAQRGILDETIKEDDVFISYKSSWDVVWPDGYNDIRTTPYLFVIERTNLEDVMNNQMLNSNKHKLKDHVGPGNTISKPTNTRMQDPTPPISISARTIEGDPELVKIKLIHVWDRRNQQVFTLAENFIEGTLFGPKKWQLLPAGFPQFPLVFNKVPSTDEKANSYPLSDVTPMLPQLKDLSQVNAAMVRHRKRMGTVILAEGDTGVTDTQAANIQQAGDMDLVIVEDINKVEAKTPPAIPASFFDMKNEILQDLFRISGMKQLMASGTGVETATESRNLREGARLRQLGKLDAIEDFTRDIATYLAGLLWQFKTREEVAKILGEEVDEQMWPTLPELGNGEIDFAKARDILTNDMWLEIEAGSTQPPEDEAVERKQFMDLIGVLKANFPNRIKDDIILKKILKKFDLTDVEEAVIANDEQEIAVAQEENKLLVQNQVQLVSPNENHELHIKVHSQIETNITINPTPAYDKHINDHATFLESMTGAQPQKGDIRAAIPSTTPELKRKGVATASDLTGAAKNVRGPGIETGGTNA